jgi:hypothetical protein
VWEWLNDPKKRPLYGFEDHLTFVPVELPGGRSGVGARTHCVHGEKLYMVETVLDWRPFEYYTVEQKLPGPLSERATFQLKPLPNGGTRLVLHERGRITSLEWIDRPLFKFLLTRVQPTEKFLTLLEEAISKNWTGEK